MLQDQAVQISEMMKELQGAQFLDVSSHIALGIVTFVLIAGCAILLARTAAVTLNSQFLRHLATSLTINAVNVLVTIAFLLSKAALAFFVIGQVKPEDPKAISLAILFFQVLNSTWAGIGTIISLLSTVFLFMAWDLLRRYPSQSVSKSLFTTLAAFFGSGSLLFALINLLIIYEKVQIHLGLVLYIIDLVSSAAGVLLVGWQLQKTLGPKMKTKSPVLKATLPWLTFIAYFIWGGSQLCHQWFKGFPWYSTLLFASSLGAIIMTIILCSYALEEKPEYSGNDVLDKLKHEQKKSGKQQVTAEWKRRYIVLLIFASIFIAFTATLLIIYKSFTPGDVSHAPLSSDVAIWITIFTTIVYATSAFSTMILAWRNDKRDAREKELKIAQLERELAASSEKPALSKPKRNRK